MWRVRRWFVGADDVIAADVISNMAAVSASVAMIRSRSRCDVVICKHTTLLPLFE